jgi:hypothetical protein
MNKIIDTGNLYTTNQGYEIEIIEYSSRRKCSIKFEWVNIEKTDVLNRLVEVKYQIHHTECF